jgi:hypothetical protein
MSLFLKTVRKRAQWEETKPVFLAWAEIYYPDFIPIIKRREKLV